MSANVIGLALANAARFVLTRQLVFGIREETVEDGVATTAEIAGPASTRRWCGVHDVAHETAGTTYDGPRSRPSRSSRWPGAG